jgi:hypothetical protein
VTAVHGGGARVAAVISTPFLGVHNVADEGAGAALWTRSLEAQAGATQCCKIGRWLALVQAVVARPALAVRSAFVQCRMING